MKTIEKKPIIYKVLEGFRRPPCFVCEINTAILFRSFRLDAGGILHLSVCEECDKMEDAEIEVRLDSFHHDFRPKA